MPGTQDKPIEAPPVRFASLKEAKEKLNAAVHFYLKQLVGINSEQTATHGYFGDLNMEEWLHFHVKHLEHHLQQYGILPRDEKIPAPGKTIIQT